MQYKAKILMSILTVVMFMCISFPVTAEAKAPYTVEQLKEDFLQLRKAVETIHPAVYVFTKKKEFDALFDKKFKKITRPMNDKEFQGLVTPLVTKINCGHSFILGPKDRDPGSSNQYMPLHPVVINGKMFVRGIYRECGIPKGAEIFSINGKTVTGMVNAFKQYASTDGFNESSTLRIVNKHFPGIFALHYGGCERFTIEYAAPVKKKGKVKGSKTVKEVDGVTGPLLQKKTPDIIPQYPPPGQRLLFEMVKEKKTAVMTIKSFSFYKNVEKFKKYIDESFAKIKKQGIEHLILDFRANSGGDPHCSSYLFRHVIKRPAPYFAKKYGSYAPLAEKLQPAENRFTGNLYILIDGGCFSSTGHLTSLLKYHGIGVFIGTETGATYTCNDNSTWITLKHTKLRLHLARGTFAAAVKNMKRSRGIKPDYHVVKSLDDYINGGDSVKDVAFKLIDR